MTSNTRVLGFALEQARRRGFLEIAFSEESLEQPASSGPNVNSVVVEWDSVQADQSRHAVTVGRVGKNKYFVSVSFRPGSSELQYVLEEMRRAYRAVGVTPEWDVDIGDAMFGGTMSHADALRLARALIDIDSRERDPDVEVAFLVMTT